MFPLNDVHLRCFLFVIFSATTLGAPGGFGSFAGSSSFSSASASAQSGSVVSSISSANAFATGVPQGGSVSSNSPHHPSISVGSGSFVGFGSNNPNSDKFGLNQQTSDNGGNTGSSKSHVRCSQCQNEEKKWEKDDYDEQYEEKEEEPEEEEEFDDCQDDGQYRPEHHHYKDGNKKHEHQTGTGIQKLAGNNQYIIDQGGIKGEPTGVGNNKQENINGGSFGHHGANTGTSGAGTLGNTNIGLMSGTNIGCSNSGSGSNCGTPGTGSNTGPVKVGLSDNIQTPIPASGLEGNGGPAGCNNFYGKCDNAKPYGTGQYPSTSVGNKENLPSGHTGNVGIQNKPNIQQTTGQWPGHANAGTSAGVYTGNVGVGNKPYSPNQQSTGQWPSAGNKPSPLDQQNTGQWPGHINTGSSSSGHTGDVGIGNKPYSPNQQSTGQWPNAGNKPSFDRQSTGQWPGQANTGSSAGVYTGNVGVGNKPYSPNQQSTGQWPSADNKPSLNQQSTGQWPGHAGASSSSSAYAGSIGVGNKPHLPNQQNTGQWPSTDNKPSSIDQQSTGQWPGQAITGSSVGVYTGNVGVGNKPYSPNQQSTGQWPSTDNKPSPLDQQSTGQWPGQTNTGSSSSGHTGNVGVGNKPYSPNQQSTGQWPGQTNTGSSSSGHTGNVGVGNKPYSPNQQSTGQWPGQANTGSSAGVYTGNVGVGNKPHLPDQQSTGQWPNAGNKPSFDQQNTGQWPGHPNTGSSSTGHVGNIGNKSHLPNQPSTGQSEDHGSPNGSGCTTSASSSPCSSGAVTVQKNLPIPVQTYEGVGTGAYAGNKNNPTTGPAGNTGTSVPHGATGFPQNGIGARQPGSLGNCGTFGGNTCTGNTGYPGSPQIGTPGVGVDQNVEKHTGDIDVGPVDKNTYQFNTANPFLFGGQGNINPSIPSHTGTIETTPKPIDRGNPFFDGTVDTSKSYDTHNSNDNNKGAISTAHGISTKPATTENPFLTHKPHGHGVHHKGDSPIYNLGITIGGIPSTSPSITTTGKPIGIDNPFFKAPGGNPMDKYPHGPHGTGITPLPTSGPYSNINQGVKGDVHHNKVPGGIANANAGALATGSIYGDRNTGSAIPGANNDYNNPDHAGGSLTGNADRNNQHSGSYDNKAISQASPSNDFTHNKGHSGSGTSINENNINNQYNPQVANAGAQSFAGANAGANNGANVGAHAGSYAGSFSSSQAGSSSSSFASSHSGSYSAQGDPNVLQQLQGNWPPLKAGAFASSNAGSWSGAHPIGVKS